MTKNELTTGDNAALPDYLKNEEVVRAGDIDSSDLIIPRIKLMQKTSPELDVFEELRSGEFFHTVAEESLGKSVAITPMRFTKSYIIWDVRDSDDPILARSSDGKIWDPQFQNTEIVFRTKDDPKGRKVKLGVDVNDNGLCEFGTSIPAKENSAPIATLTYNWLLYVEGHGPALMSMSRSGVTPARQFISKIDARGVSVYGQAFLMKSKVVGEGSESYLIHTFTANGYAPQEVHDACKAFLDTYKDVNVRAADEDDGESTRPKQGGKSKGKVRDDL